MTRIASTTPNIPTDPDKTLQPNPRSTIERTQVPDTVRLRVRLRSDRMWPLSGLQDG